jgi:hypothetical protein
MHPGQMDDGDVTVSKRDGINVGQKGVGGASLEHGG